ncbi:MAG TPA: translation initiation factor IF-2 subunit beta [Candidatus Nanoarchaeia archaeon]|nr:translation initiation factor IF-2 subunit beta [Candidatus Nanoarchaeia archaeon]
MKTYEEMLKEAMAKVKTSDKTSDRFEVPKVAGAVSGKNTLITNIKQIADYVRRPVDHLSKFLLKELATSGKIEGDRLVLNTKVNSVKVNDKVLQYTKEFVICKECGKPDTEIVTEKGIKYKHCLACGAKSPVRASI